MRKFITISTLFILIIFSFNSITLAGKKETASKSEIASGINKDKANKEIGDETKKSGEVSSEDGQSSSSEESTHESAWRIPGWQSIFAVLAILYYFIVSIKILPKIASREGTEKE